MSFDEQMKEFVESERDRKPAGRRERIATAALQGLLAGSSLKDAWDNDGISEEQLSSLVAQVACGYADALIAELDREKGE